MKLDTACSAAVAGVLAAGLLFGCGGGSTTPGPTGSPSAGAGGAANPGSAGASPQPSAGAANPSGGAGGMVAGGGAATGNAGSMGVSGGAVGGNVGTAGNLGTSGSPGMAGNTSAGGSGGGATVSGVAFDSARVTITGVRGVTAVASSVLKLHNGGTAAVQVTAIAISGANQAQFNVMNPATFPVSLAAGADLSVTITMSTTTGLVFPADAVSRTTGSLFLTGTLTATLSSGSATASVFGLVSAMANYEATLGEILMTQGYKMNVGKAQDNWNSNTSMNPAMLPGVEAGTDEVAAQHFVKAGAGNVGISLVARFSPKGALPFGWYSTTTGCPAGCMTVGTMSSDADAQTSDKARMVNPPPGAGSMTSFDPGAGPFGLWIYSDQKTQKFNVGTAASVHGDYDYTQDSLSTPANVHRIKSFQLKDASGTAIPRSYLVCVEEAGNGDYQDYVFLLSNVTPSP